jgi:hypothetical protein
MIIAASLLLCTGDDEYGFYVADPLPPPLTNWILLREIRNFLLATSKF